MLLRSSSTPILGSLISSFTDSPNHTHSLHLESCHMLNHLPPPTTHRLSCSSSPISPSIADLERQNKGLIRRVQSEGNLEDLAYATCNNEERYNHMDPSKRYSGKQRGLPLETIPSFSLSKQTGLREEEEDEESDMEEEGYDEFSVMSRMMVSEEVEDRVCRVSFGDEGEVGNREMYLAKGLGIDSCGGGDGIGGGCRGGGGNGGGDYNSMDSDRNDGDNNNHGVEEYYKKMVQQNPGNPLFLRNYAQYLYQCKQDLEGAEEYYSRAILADPNDGEVLSQYGKLIWELHHDEERASSYFERAVQASPLDSHVQAAYASFLWDTEEDEGTGYNDSQCFPQQFHFGEMATTGA
ncbi:uncharacterized protein LOC131610049 [Vicia villosa]|uniref:uncharacterized protein LOC131610049 n=1 Tax=Vicia villosa TaxID=3911 RepID=UPI00273C7B0D|nr:uncharacterized protein LOC131610049 [Vicia villosa]XP_058737892.1 uncharacterized protein LOC131610049 [Vicia villosa]